MSYSIFSDTMVDMTYTQIEVASKKNIPILFPIAVIEEHGPHMCLGTDTYLTYDFCKKLKKELANYNIDSLIAPPFYWGVNSITNGFPGSFVVKSETMMTIVLELLENLKAWGFDNIFLFNFHGDYKHIQTIFEVAKKAYNEQNIGAYFVAQDLVFRIAGLSGKEPNVIEIPTNQQSSSQYIDIHAGSFETSWMVKNFPDLVDINQAGNLKSSFTSIKDLKTWLQGGQKAREITPLGYCGNPSEINVEKAAEIEQELIVSFAKYIYEFIKTK
ncbi:MAG: creatininase family protein [Clostridiaceae bacterium]